MAKRKVVIDEEFDESNSSSNSPGTFNDLLIDKLKKDIGGSIYVLGQDETPADVKEWLTTGSTQLDMCISNNPNADGGIPVGRLTTIAGEHSTGKSLLAYMILADCARKGGVSVLIDTENAANIAFLKMLGLDPKENLVYSQVDTVEDVFEVIEAVIEQVRKSDKNKLVTIVWDSIALTSTRVEMENEVGDQQYAIAPRLIGQGLRKVMRLIGKERIALVFLNQLRTKIGVVFGDPDFMPGGRSIPFNSDVMIRLRTAGKTKIGNDVIGVNTKAIVQKTRFGPPFREAILNIYFDRGLIDEEAWIDYLLKKNLVKKAPQISDPKKLSKTDSVLIYKDEEHRFKNKEFPKFLKDHPEMRNYFMQMIKEDLYVEQNPELREEEVIVEELDEEPQPKKNKK
jgi:recombination protein RecA